MMANNRVLFIDDDQELLSMYRTVFEANDGDEPSALMVFAQRDPPEGPRERYEVHTAAQGEDGVALARRFLLEERPFAVAFVDIRMPPGIDGLETARLLRQLDERLFIIIVTAFSDHSIDEIQLAVHHDVVLARKPLTDDEIVQLARNACLSWQRNQGFTLQYSQLRQKVDDLQQDHWLFVEMINMFPTAVFICNARGTVISCNAAAYQLLQYPRGLVTLTSMDHYFIPEQASVVEVLLQQGHYRNLPHTLTTYDGDLVPVLVTAGVLPGLAQRPRSLVFVVRETTTL